MTAFEPRGIDRRSLLLGAGAAPVLFLTTGVDKVAAQPNGDLGAQSIPPSANWALAPSDFSQTEIWDHNTWVHYPTPATRPTSLTRAPDTSKPGTRVLVQKTHQGCHLDASGEWTAPRTHTDHSVHTGLLLQGPDLIGTELQYTDPDTSTHRIVKGKAYSAGLQLKIPAAYIAKAGSLTWSIFAQHNSGDTMPPFALEVASGDLRVRVRGDVRTAAEIKADDHNFFVNKMATIAADVVADTWYSLRYEIVHDEVAGGVGRVKVWVNEVLKFSHAGQVGYFDDCWVLWFGNYCYDINNDSYNHRIRNVWFRYNGPA